MKRQINFYGVYNIIRYDILEVATTIATYNGPCHTTDSNKASLPIILVERMFLVYDLVVRSLTRSL